MVPKVDEYATLTGWGEGGTVAVMGVLQAAIARHARSKMKLCIASFLEIQVVKR